MVTWRCKSFGFIVNVSHSGKLFAKYLIFRDFDNLFLTYLLKPSKFEEMLQDYLHVKYSLQETLRIQELIQSQALPILFVVTPGHDPSPEIRESAKMHNVNLLQVPLDLY